MQDVKLVYYTTSVAVSVLIGQLVSILFKRSVLSTLLLYFSLTVVCVSLVRVSYSITIFLLLANGANGHVTYASSFL